MTDDTDPAKTFTSGTSAKTFIHFLAMLPIRVPDELAELQENTDPCVYKRAVDLVMTMDAFFDRFYACIDGVDILIRACHIDLECYVLKDAPPGRQADELFRVQVWFGSTTLASYHTNAADAARTVISEYELSCVD